MNFSSPQILNPAGVRAIFIEQLGILYNAKVNLTNCLPGLVEQATFKNLKLALTENLEETAKQMISLKSIFNLLDESWLTNDCLGTNAVIHEAQRHIAFSQEKHFESDMSILFYMSVVENLQVGASQMLQLLSLKLAYQPYAQLVDECLDTVKDNSALFYCVAEEYLQS